MVKIFRWLFVCIVLSISTIPLLACADDNAGMLDRVTRAPSFTSHRASSSNAELDKNGDSKSVPPGETLVLGEFEGPGVITHIWCTISTDYPFLSRALVLRFYWDGAENPSVEVPLGDFFGVGHGAMAEYTSLPVACGSHGRARVCYWRMPFKKSARVTVTNESDKYKCDSFYYYLDWEKHDALPEDTAYFHAQYRQAAPATPGDYVILDTQGRGQYVGTVYSVHQMENGWFGEGDDRFYIDGEETPSLRGTGSEDYFNDAWGFRRFATPFYGVSLWEGYFAGDRVTAYRWHLPDPVAFNKSLKVSIEHKGSIFTDQIGELGGFIERNDWISSVAFWYQTPPAELTQPLAPLAERLPPYRIIPAEDLVVRAKPEMLMLKQEGTLAYMPATPDASIEIDFDLEKDGHYVIAAMIPHSLLGSIYQPMLDGKPIGAPLDVCVEGLDNLWVDLERHVLTAGKHTLRFEGRGPSPHLRSMAKPMYAFGVQYLVLLRLEDMAGFQEAMKKTQEARPAFKLW